MNYNRLKHIFKFKNLKLLMFDFKQYFKTRNNIFKALLIYDFFSIFFIKRSHRKFIRSLKIDPNNQKVVSFGFTKFFTDDFKLKISEEDFIQKFKDKILYWKCKKL